MRPDADRVRRVSRDFDADPIAEDLGFRRRTNRRENNSEDDSVRFVRSFPKSRGGGARTREGDGARLLFFT